MAARISPTNPRPEINTRQELFCRLIAEGRSQYESYTEAGFKATTRGAADVEACKLLKAPKITARVKEIQAENALAARISVTKMYVAIYDKARANNDLGPAAAAVTGVAKLHGLVIDRAQIEPDLCIMTLKQGGAVRVARGRPVQALFQGYWAGTHKVRLADKKNPLLHQRALLGRLAGPSLCNY